MCRNSNQGPIDYTLYEAYGGSAGKAISAVLNNARATRVAIGLLATMVVSAVVMGIFERNLDDFFRHDVGRPGHIMIANASAQ